MNRKTVSWLIGKTHYDLEGMRCFRLRLKVGKRRREARFTELHLHKEPRFAVPHHQKIHFAFLFVSQITQFEIAKPKISPAFHRLVP